MTNATFALIYDQNGTPGLARSQDLGNQTGDVEVLLQNRSSVQVSREYIQQGEEGLYSAAVRFDALIASAATSPDDVLIIPVLEEHARIDKHWVETGVVRITKSVNEEVKNIESMLRQEEVEVQRVAFNLPLDEPVEARYEGDVFIIPVVEEVLVIQKQLMLREEVRITRRRKEKRIIESVTLHQEEVNVERLKSTDDKE